MFVDSVNMNKKLSEVSNSSNENKNESGSDETTEYEVEYQELSSEVWIDNYQGPEEQTIEDTWERQARACSSVEDESIREKVYEDFLWLLKDFKGIAGGRITANLGISGRNATTLFNCFVLSPMDLKCEDPDSINGIYDMLKSQAQTLKSEGGYGVNFSWIRPAGTFIEGIASRTPGVLKFMELWDKSSEIITMGSEKNTEPRKDGEKKKIRKGAQMAVLCCWHPEIEDFIAAKQIEGRLSKFNISVGITPGFMDAVKNNKSWDLKFPNTKHPLYKTQWRGDLEEWESKGLPVIVHKTIMAKDLWDKIMQSTYMRNDPGVLFLDLANELNPINYAEKIFTTNPCFHGDERFLTESGYLKFKDSSSNKQDVTLLTDNRIFYENDGAPETPNKWKFNLTQKGTTKRNSGCAFVTKEYSDLLLLEFDNGQQLRCTKDHHIATTVGMVEAQYLTKDHLILVSTPYESGASILDILPETNEEISAFLMGLISGDGCIHKNTVHIDLWGNDKSRMKEIVVNFIEKLHASSNIDISLLPNNWQKRELSKYNISEVEKYDKIRITSTWLNYYLKQNYNYYSDTKFIVPEFILNNARTKIGLFYLSGMYYADGTVSGNIDKGVSVRLSQSNKDFLREIQLILHANGISSKIYKRRDAGTMTCRGHTYDTKDNFEIITTCGGWKPFSKIISFNHPEKDSKLKYFSDLIKENYNIISNTTLENKTNIDGSTVYCIKEDITRSIIVNSISTRRCGEISMSTGVCLLFSFNLVKFIKKNGDDFEFDFDTFKKAVSIATRFADNINDISRTPLPEYDQSLKEKRRIGMGVLGLGSLHYILGIKFGSKDSLELIEKIFKTKAETEILTSAKLGQEKGNFPLFDKDKYFSTKWWNTLPISKDIKKQVEKLGTMRNSHHSANAPTGNMSVYAGCVSGGIEPVFLKEYIRWVIVTEGERARLRKEGFEFPDVFKQEWFETKHMKESKAGTDSILLGTFDGVDYQVDKNRGLTKKVIVKDWGWLFAQKYFSKEKLEKMEKDGIFITTNDLSVDEHINTLKVISKYVNMNSSKTVNVPKDYSYEDFKNLYMMAYDSNIKGITSYRAGTMTAVLESIKENSTISDRDRSEIITTVAPKRPKELPCEIHHATAKGKKWTVLIGLLGDKPYEIFTGLSENISLPAKYTKGKIVKQSKGKYNLHVSVGDDEELIIKDIVKTFDNPESSWATRMISTSLRHGVPVHFICDQLSKDGLITDVNKVLSRILKKYITDDIVIDATCPECGSTELKYVEGCISCLSCSYSKCG